MRRLWRRTVVGVTGSAREGLHIDVVSVSETGEFLARGSRRHDLHLAEAAPFAGLLDEATVVFWWFLRGSDALLWA